MKRSGSRVLPRVKFVGFWPWSWFVTVANVLSGYSMVNGEGIAKDGFAVRPVGFIV